MKKGLFMIMAMVMIAFTVASCGSQKSADEVVESDSTEVVDVAPAPLEDIVVEDTVIVEVETTL